MTRTSIAFAALAFLIGVSSSVQAEEQMTEEQVQQWFAEFTESLDPQRGETTVPGASAEFRLGDAFAFLDANDTRRLLEEAWGNPPDPSVLGAIIPYDFDPIGTSAWAVIVEYEEDGYVEDGDAAEINYDELLASMQEETSASNSARIEAGYSGLELIGWAEPPYYDPDSHKLYWAKEISFGGNSRHTLNYSIRALGRRGVLVLNAVGGMDQLSTIQTAMQDLLPMVAFEEGSRYVDFDPDVDQVAAYGIGALVAGKLAAKAGLLAKFAPLLLGLKKFGIVIIAGVIGVGRRFFMSGREAETDEDKPIG